MNVMWYVGKFDEASWQLFAAMGLSRSRMQKENRGVAGVEQHITALGILYGAFAA
jgi:acyl-CoA thioester hydrolase